MSPWLPAARLDAIPPSGLLPVVVGGERLLLCRPESGGLYAFEDRCTHDGAPLSDGSLAGAILECARHGGRFDVESGEARRMPAALPLLRFPVRVAASGIIEVELEEP